MVRITPTVLTGTVLVCAAIGCANFIEMSAIEHFTGALEKNDLTQLKSTASDSFDEKALRRQDSIDAVKIVYQHPEEKLTIVKVENDGPDRKKVQVTTEKTHRKLEFKLVRDAKSGKWVVDDIVFKQKNKDVTAAKSLTEQMDLLLVVQDFLVAWHKGKREDVQAVTTASFGKLLGELPPTLLERLTKRVAGERIKPEEFRPEATIDGMDAIVKLQRAKGILVLSMRLTNKGWKVSDVQVESRKDKDQLASARRTATVIRTVVNFLKAYQANDKPGLQKVVVEKFYESCFKVADLKLVPLPAPDVLGEKDIVSTHEKTGEYLLKRGNETVKIALVCPEPTAEYAKFYVDEVTIFDSKSEKRLAALFTAQAKMQLFVNAMLKGNVALMRENSSKDFDAKVWRRLKDLPLAEVLPPEVELVQPTMTDPTDYRGPVIRIPVRQGTRDLTYVMRDWSGDVAVDDVLMPCIDRPQSLKDTLQVMLPIRLLASSLREASTATDGQEREIELLKSVTSRDFTRLVWSQLSQLPESAFTVLPHLDMPPTSITETSTGQLVILGDERFGARIELVRETGNLMVDRIWLLTGQGEPSELKHSLKTQLAKRGSRGIGLDPLSAHPIPTDPAGQSDPSRTASAEMLDTEPTTTAPPARTPRGRVPSTSGSPSIIESPRRSSIADPVDAR